MKNSQGGEKYVVSLRKHVFRTPNWILSLTVSSIFIVIISFLIHPHIKRTLLLFLAPYLLTILLDHLVIKAMRVYFPLRRITALNLLAFLISFVQFWILNYFYSLEFSYFIAFSSVIFLRYIIYRAFLSEHRVMAGVISSFYTLSIFIFSYTLFHHFEGFILSAIVYGIMAHIFLLTTTVVFRREFREDPLFFIASFINYASRKTGEDVKKLNQFFHRIYGNRKIPVSTMVFRSKNGVKGVFVVPYVHPGPFGVVGGSDLPNKLEKYTGMKNLMVFHSTTTHDNNIADEEDVKKIAQVVKESIKEDCSSDTMSDLHRFEINGIRYAVQVFGRYPFIALVPHRGNFDDVELKTGLMIRKAIMNNFDDAMVVDAHNNFNPNALPLTLTSSDIFRLKRVIANIKADKKIKLGIGFRELKGESIGHGGVRVAVFEYGRKKIAYVLFDGNNVKQGLREFLRKELMQYVNDVEIFSTDNHAVNMGMIDHNPVGERDDWHKIADTTLKAVRDAIEDLEDVCVAMSTKFVDVRMAFSGQIEKLAEITKTSLGRAKVSAPLTFIGGFIISYFILNFL